MIHCSRLFQDDTGRCVFHSCMEMDGEAQASLLAVIRRCTEVQMMELTGQAVPLFMLLTATTTLQRLQRKDIRIHEAMSLT